MQEEKKIIYAGFWVRFFSYVVDSVIISLIVFPIALVLSLLLPQHIELSVPLNILTTIQVVKEESNINGKKVEIIQKNVLGLREYYFKRVSASDGKTVIARSTMIDKETKLPKSMMSSSELGFYFYFLYMILLEGSVFQASFGKKVAGIKVISENGRRPSYSQTIMRNLLKLLSGIILFIGFMMAGWTNKKQALHDKISKTLVIDVES